MFRSVLAEVRQRPARLLLTGLAVLVATAFAAGTLLFTDTLRATVRDGVSGVPEGAAVVVDARHPAAGETAEGGPEGLDPALATRVAELPGVADTRAVREGPVALARTGGTADPGYWRVVSDSFQGSLSSYQILRGSAPSGPGEVALTREAADRLGLGVGDRVVLRPGADAADREVTVTALTLGPFLEGSGTVVAPDDTAAELGARSVSRLLVAAQPGVAPAELTKHVANLVSGQGKAHDAGQLRQERLAEHVRSFDQVLVLLSIFTGMAMVSAAIVVAATFRIVVAQRRRQTALLRCVGAGRGQVVASLLAEAALSGLVAGVLGAVLAWLLGQGTVALVRNWLDQPQLHLQVSLGGLVLCVGLAVLVTVLAAVLPAVSGSRVPPVAALGAAPTVDVGQGVTRLRWVLAGLLATGSGGLAALALATSRGDLPTLTAVACSGMLAFGALAAAAPIILSRLARLLAWLVQDLGKIPLRVAVGNVLRMPRRTAATTLVLALGVAMVSAVLVGVSSARASVDEQLAGSRPAALVISPAFPDGPGIAPEVVSELRALPAAGYVTASTETRAGVGDVRGLARGTELSEFPPLRRGVVYEGALTDLGPGRVGLYKDVAERLGKHAGDQLTLHKDGRRVTLTVAAVYRNAGSLGSFALNPTDLAALDPSARVTRVLLDPAPNHDRNQLRAAVDRALAGNTNVVVQAPGDERAAFEEISRVATLIALGLVGITVLVAVVGVGTTLSLSVVERTQESGLLRALGLQRAGVAAALAWEAVLFGGSAAVLGITAGTGYGVLTLTAMSVFEVIAIPYEQLVVVALGLVALLLVASAGPARRASRTTPLQALATE
ncbi:ABC transporter permease [Longimycelium tulufanense]|uniref:ABC transporter permease n=1 Tax=Longimycelium tulufanense TaxID=907463 RepID=UPI001E526521|nr:FtsX-like permease family protein [Longimycelium tulufanense]